MIKEEVESNWDSKEGGRTPLTRGAKIQFFFKIKWIFSIKALIKERIINYIINS